MARDASRSSGPAETTRPAGLLTSLSGEWKAAREERAVKRAAALAEAREKKEAEKRARDAARREEEASSSPASSRREREVPAVASRGGSGFFSRLAISAPGKYRSKGHGVKVNHVLLAGLSPSNAEIEVDLSEQKARVIRVAGGRREVVIETSVSTGKPGHSTPTGTYRISEKQVEKRSTLYGRWLDASGRTVQSDGESGYRPSGATTFVGAEMPYWMRINGGIGMHVGYVPDHPASHGCIRVPGAVQPLIYSKVGVGTKISIVN